MKTLADFFREPGIDVDVPSSPKAVVRCHRSGFARRALSAQLIIMIGVVVLAASPAAARLGLIAQEGRMIGTTGLRLDRLYHPPQIDDSGSIFFESILADDEAGTTHLAILSGSPSKIPTVLLHDDQPAADGVGTNGLAEATRILMTGEGEALLPVNRYSSGSDRAVVAVSNEGHEVVVRVGEPAPGTEGSYGGIFVGHSRGRGNRLISGRVQPTGDYGLWAIRDGGPAELVTRVGDPSPDGNGTLDGLRSHSMNSQGQVAFAAMLTDTVGQWTDDQAIYLWEDGQLATIARNLGPGTDRFSGVILDENGHAFTYASNNAETGLFMADRSGVTPIALYGQEAPGGIGRYLAIGVDDFRVAGDRQMVFRAHIDDGTTTGTGISGYPQAIVRHSQGTTDVIAYRGDAAPGGGTLAYFGLPQFAEIAPGGQVVFGAGVVEDDGTSPGGWNVFISDGVETISVARIGDQLGDRQITSAVFGADNNSNRSFNDQRKSINRHGQVALQVTLDDGQKQSLLYTPDLHWRGPSSGHWGDSQNWTLGLPPAHVHDVTIGGDGDGLTITGPTVDTAIRSLTVADGGSLVLTSHGKLSARAGMQIDDGGRLEGAGVADGHMLNAGELHIGGDGTGTIEVTDLYRQTGTMRFDVHGDDDYDRLVVGLDAALIDGAVEIAFSYDPSGSRMYQIIEAQGYISQSRNVDLVITGLDASLVTFDVRNGTIHVVPEPATLGMLMAGLVLCASRRRRN